MVLAYPPQQFGNSIVANTIFRPQSMGFRGGPTITKLIEVLPEVPIADATFDHYKLYTIDTGQVPTAQTNMPLVLIDSLPAGTFVGTTGFDIRVFDSNGDPIAYEVQLADINANGSGDIIIWFDMPVVDVDEFIQVTFGKAGAIDGQNPGGVYDSNYKTVYHLNGVGTDSTSNAQNGTIFGTTTVAGKIGNALDFPGGTLIDYVIRNPFTGFPSTALTVSYWIETTGTVDGMVSYAVTGSDDEFLTLGQESFLVAINDAVAFIFNSFNDGTFHHITVTWRSSDGQLVIYDDAVNISSTTIEMGASLTDGGSVVLAQDQGNVGGGFAAGRALDGILDEVVIEDVVRDQDFITTRHNNQSDNDAFWSESALLSSVPSILTDSPNGDQIQVVELVV